MEVIGMALFLLIVYILFLILHIILNVKAFRNKAKKYWTYIFFIESVSIIIALTVMLYYKSLPGYGMMPGFSETSISHRAGNCHTFSFGSAENYEKIC